MSPLSMSLGTSAAHGAIVPLGKAVMDSSTYLATFANIPQGYQDIMVVVNGRSLDSGSMTRPPSIGLNGDLTNIMSGTYMLGGGSGSGTSTRFANYGYADFGLFPAFATAPNFVGSAILHILNYANTTAYKTILARSNGDLNGSGETRISALLWAKTNAVTEVNISSYGNFAPGSIINIYGVRSIGQ